MLEQARTTQRRNLSPPSDEKQLTDDIIALATRYGRYGYRRITAMLKDKGWQVNHKRVERIWRKEGLRCQRNNPREVDYGLMMVPVSGSGRSTRTMSGATIS